MQGGGTAGGGGITSRTAGSIGAFEGTGGSSGRGLSGSKSRSKTAGEQLQAGRSSTSPLLAGLRTKQNLFSLIETGDEQDSDEDEESGDTDLMKDIADPNGGAAGEASVQNLLSLQIIRELRKMNKKGGEVDDSDSSGDNLVNGTAASKLRGVELCGSGRGSGRLLCALSAATPRE